MAEINWTDIATRLGLSEYPGRRGPFGQEGFIAGNLEGQLVIIGPARTRSGPGLGILIHSPPIPDDRELQMALETHPVVLQALGKEKQEWADLNSLLQVDQENVAFLWPFRRRPPPAETIAELARAIAAQVTRMVGERSRDCQRCGQPDSPVMLVDGAPVYLCKGCADVLRFASDEALREYAQKSPNLPLGLLFGAGAGLAGAVAWAIVALLTQRIFLILAIGIGLIVGWAVHRGMGKFTWAGQVAAVLITLGSVLVGDLLYVALLLVREGADFFQAILAVLLNLNVIFGESDTWVSLFFGLIGALYILYRYRQPRVETTVEPL